MMFVAGPLKMALATIHTALMDIRNLFTIGRVFEPIDLLDAALKEYFGIPRPRIGVAGLNPHAGEDGQFGDEEKRIIEPAIMLAQENHVDCRGPFPPIRFSCAPYRVSSTALWRCTTTRGSYR